jgi:hypothetical protein
VKIYSFLERTNEFNTDARRMENLCEGNFFKGFKFLDYCPHRFNAKGALEKRGENEPLIVAFSNS